VSALREVQNLTGHSPEQLALGDPALCRELLPRRFPAGLNSSV